ncbi:MAG: hypothetical protein AB1758_10035 [Candidatus Eremiobacterota bacterium]
MAIAGFAHCTQDTQEIDLPGGYRARVPGLPGFLATKLEAFASRGGEAVGDEDLEDIVSVLGHCPGIVEQIETSRDPLRAFLVERLRGLRAMRDLLQVVTGCFDATVADRSHRVLEVLSRVHEIEPGPR